MDINKSNAKVSYVLMCQFICNYWILFLLNILYIYSIYNIIYLIL